MQSLCSFISLYNMALRTGNLSFTVQYTKSIEQVCKLLLEKGYISAYRIILPSKSSNKAKLLVHVLYRVIRSIHLVSTPSKRVKISYPLLCKYYGFMGSDSDLILRTSKGFQFGSTCIRLKIGGEILFRLN